MNRDMARFFTIRLCLAALAVVLAASPVVRSMMAMQMEMDSAGAIPDGCKGCVGDKVLAGSCATMCAMPVAVISDLPAAKPRTRALFELSPDDPVAGLAPLPDPPRPRLLLRA
jgi:hypothetical protein